jgi:hypothetical protein
MLKFRIYIPFGGDNALLNKCVNSVIPQMDAYSSYEDKKIVVMNNSDGPISIDRLDAVDIWEMPFELVHAQQMNWMLKDAVKEGYPICVQLHTDAELLPGAMKCMIETYEQIKDTKWFAYGIGGSIFVALNPDFFVKENVWYDPFLFPMYYMDNHIGRIANLRGWSDNTYGLGTPLVNHVSSHHLKTNPIFRARNNAAFSAHGQTYANIWGGLPGAETSRDPYAGGTLSAKV